MININAAFPFLKIKLIFISNLHQFLFRAMLKINVCVQNIAILSSSYKRIWYLCFISFIVNFAKKIISSYSVSKRSIYGIKYSTLLARLQLQARTKAYQCS